MSSAQQDSVFRTVLRGMRTASATGVGMVLGALGGAAVGGWAGWNRGDSSEAKTTSKSVGQGKASENDTPLHRRVARLRQRVEVIRMVQTASMSLHYYGQQEQERALEELHRLREKFKHRFSEDDFSWLDDEPKGVPFDDEDEGEDEPGGAVH